MLETKTAITAKPAANSAKAANSSLTKYNCSATPSAKNHHIHLRLLSSVLVIGLVSLYEAPAAVFGLVRCAPLPVRSSLPHLNHLTPSEGRNRWYRRHIFAPK